MRDRAGAERRDATTGRNSAELLNVKTKRRAEDWNAARNTAKTNALHQRHCVRVVSAERCGQAQVWLLCDVK